MSVSTESLIITIVGGVIVGLVLRYCFGIGKSKSTSPNLEIGGNYFNNVIASGNGRDGIHIQSGSIIPKEDLSTHQRLLIETLRDEWSHHQKLSQIKELTAYADWRKGELEWINKELKRQGKSWRVE